MKLPMTGLYTYNTAPAAPYLIAPGVYSFPSAHAVAQCAPND
ncbi:hypothetical protein AWB74_00254 [Caballeronia arvi]|uniref:Uncharacterized protein n=1 Tax=Caballeronia arvi TaxID=1777135 RepID=A0A158EYU1_9BURK|nr:hypothetical protein AWB74_00254 [Caballeronia arvi]